MFAYGVRGVVTTGTGGSVVEGTAVATLAVADEVELIIGKRVHIGVEHLHYIGNIGMTQVVKNVYVVVADAG